MQKSRPSTNKAGTTCIILIFSFQFSSGKYVNILQGILTTPNTVICKKLCFSYSRIKNSSTLTFRFAKYHSLHKNSGYQLLYSTVLPPVLTLWINHVAVGDHQQHGDLSAITRSSPNTSCEFPSEV